MILLLSLGQVKNVVKFTQTSLGGFPEHPNDQKNKGQAAARDTGINWSGYSEVKFEVQPLLVFNQVFPKLYKVSNVGNKGSHWEQQNKFSKKIASSGDWTQNLLIITLMFYWLC